MLDGELDPSGSFEHELTSGRNAWIHAINGEIDVAVSGKHKRLRQGQAIAIGNSENEQAITVLVSASEPGKAHFTLLDGEAIQEPFVQQGPFVMGSKDEIEATHRAFSEGRFGSID